MFATGGDGLATAFSTASDALEAAVDAQRRLAVERWSEPVGLRVRMAVHTGVADERGGDYFGPTLNRTARLMAAARGGQILVSSATERLLQDRADAGWSLIELGEVRLKDLTLPERAPLLPEADNLAAAVAFAITAKDAVSLARLLGGGGEMWAHVGRMRQVGQWWDATLPLVPAAPDQDFPPTRLTLTLSSAAAALMNAGRRRANLGGASECHPRRVTRGHRFRAMDGRRAGGVPRRGSRRRHRHAAGGPR